MSVYELINLAKPYRLSIDMTKLGVKVTLRGFGLKKEHIVSYEQMECAPVDIIATLVKDTKEELDYWVGKTKLNEEEI